MHAEMALPAGRQGDRRALRLARSRASLPRLRRRGSEDDHEGTHWRRPGAPARDEAHAALGSAWHDVDDQIRAVTGQPGPRHFILCTDDCHPETR
jgi:adenine deaminase